MPPRLASTGIHGPLRVAAPVVQVGSYPDGLDELKQTRRVVHLGASGIRARTFAQDSFSRKLPGAFASSSWYMRKGTVKVSTLGST